ncbi:MAG: hypothetical protein KBD78_04100 [Oligoflexales bacterium]|nr:hypothetical protein [Oligoflexales bacterium]
MKQEDYSNDLLNDLKEKMDKAKKQSLESKQIAYNSYGHGYSFGEYEAYKRVIYFIQNNDWPEF